MLHGARRIGRTKEACKNLHCYHHVMPCNSMWFVCPLFSFFSQPFSCCCCAVLVLHMVHHVHFLWNYFLIKRRVDLFISMDRPVFALACAPYFSDPDVFSVATSMRVSFTYVFSFFCGCFIRLCWMATFSIFHSVYPCFGE